MRSDALKTFISQFGARQLTAEQLFGGISTGEFSLCVDGGEVDAKQLETAIKRALPCINAIVRDPNAYLSGRLELKRAESAGTLSSAGIRETIRDMRVWKNIEGEVRPADVYGSVNEENIDTYENRVVKALIDRSIRILSDTCNRLSSQVKTLRGAQMQYGNLSKADMAYIMGERQVLQSEGFAYSDYSLFARLRRSFLRLRNSDFYLEMSKIPDFSDHTVTLTNVFWMNKNYAACYDLWNFYNKNFSVQGGMDGADVRSAYTSFVAIALAYAYTRIGFVPSDDFYVESFKNPLALDKLKLEREDMSVTFHVSERQIDVVVVCPKAGARQTVAIGIHAEKTKPNLSNVQYVACLYDQEYGDSVICARPDVPDSLRNFVSLARLTTYTLDVPQDVYENVCPVCGKRHVEFNGLKYVCEDCGAVYLFLDKSKIWLSHFQSHPSDYQ